MAINNEIADIKFLSITSLLKSEIVKNSMAKTTQII